MFKYETRRMNVVFIPFFQLNLRCICASLCSNKLLQITHGIIRAAFDSHFGYESSQRWMGGLCGILAWRTFPAKTVVCNDLFERGGSNPFLLSNCDTTLDLPQSVAFVEVPITRLALVPLSGGAPTVTRLWLSCHSTCLAHLLYFTRWYGRALSFQI